MSLGNEIELVFESRDQTDSNGFNLHFDVIALHKADGGYEILSIREAVTGQRIDLTELSPSDQGFLHRQVSILIDGILPLSQRQLSQLLRNDSSDDEGI